MRKAYIFAPLLGTLLLAACDDDETEPNPTLAITVGEAITIVQGQSASTTITVARGGGYDDEVDLTVSNLPAGVTAVLAPEQIPAGSGAGTSTLTLTADATAVPGTATFTIEAEATTRAGLVASATGSVTVNEAPGFSLAVDPATLEVQAGASGTSDVTITRTGGFAEAVNLTVTNLPAGVTFTFDNAAPTGNAAVLTLSADATATTGASTITVTGTGTPGTETADIALTITAAAGGFTVSVTPTTINAQAGGTGTATVTINKTGTFTSPVTLSVTGLPAGITAAFNPASPSAPASSRDVEVTSTLTLTVTAGVAAQAYEFQIKGNAEGQPEASVTATVNVTAAPAPGNTTFKFCDLNNLPVWVAFQDGTGAWTSVTGQVAADGTTYSFDITQATGGVAYVTGNATDGFNTSVFFGSQAELIAMGSAQCTAQPSTSRTLSGSVSNIGATDQVNISMGGASALATGAQLTFTLNGVLDAPSDLFATQSTVAAGPPIAVTPVKMIIRRGLDIATGGTIPVLDFSAAEAFVPQTATVTLNNLGTDNPLTFLAYLTPTTSGPLYTTPGTAGTTQTVYGVPAAQQQPTDLHVLNVIAASATPGDSRGHFAWFNVLADKTVTLGPVLNPPTVTALAGSAYPRYQATAAVQAEYDDSFVFVLTQAGTSARSTTVTSTKGYLAGATDYTLAIPDLTAAGYQALWGLATGTAVTTSTAAFGVSGTGTTLPRVEGGTADFATRGGQVTP